MSEDEIKRNHERAHEEITELIKSLDIPAALRHTIDQTSAKAEDALQAGLMFSINGMISHEAGDAPAMAEYGTNLVDMLTGLSMIETRVLCTTLFTRYAMHIIGPYGSARAFAAALRADQVPGFSDKEPFYDLPPL